MTPPHSPPPPPPQASSAGRAPRRLPEGWLPAASACRGSRPPATLHTCRAALGSQARTQAASALCSRREEQLAGGSSPHSLSRSSVSRDTAGTGAKGARRLSLLALSTGQWRCVAASYTYPGREVGRDLEALWDLIGAGEAARCAARAARKAEEGTSCCLRLRIQNPCGMGVFGGQVKNSYLHVP